MEYYGKKLPKGFMYMLTKKQIREISDQVENSILAVRLAGTSYSESKMADKSLSTKLAIFVYSYLVEEKICFILTQYGVRLSNLGNSDEILMAQQSVISKLVKVIYSKKRDYIENKFTSGMIYLYVDVFPKIAPSNL